MRTATCGICRSPLREEIERKARFRTKPINIIAWARDQGVSISYSSLSSHREKHMNGKPFSHVQSGNGDSPSASGVTFSGNGHKGKGDIVLIEKVTRKKRPQSVEPAPVETEVAPVAETEPITDELLLNAVRDAVYGKLKEGALELEIGSAFKAIEIKHKIGEQSQTEKMMVEILNEIRSQELGKVQE
jgi:hypothetical protein